MPQAKTNCKLYNVKRKQIPSSTSLSHQHSSVTAGWEEMESFDHWHFHSTWQICDTCSAATETHNTVHKQRTMHTDYT